MAAELGSKDKRRRYLALLDRDGSSCYWCFEVFSPINPYSLDHVTPTSRGGGNGLDNLVLACFWCNNARADRTPQEYMAWLAENYLPFDQRAALSKTIKKQTTSRSKYNLPHT